jgi:MRG
MVKDSSNNNNNRKRKKEDSSSSLTTTTTTSMTPWNNRRPKTSNQASSNNTSVVVVVSYQEYCELPFTLHTILVDEHNYITRKGFDSPHHGYDCDDNMASRPARSVHHLPAKVTVKQVLQHYQRKRGGGKDDTTTTNSTNDSSDNNENKDDNNNNNNVAEPMENSCVNNINNTTNKKKKNVLVKKFCTGLAMLFDDVLPVCLLYPEERPQYESLQHLDEDLKLKRPSEIYGSTFLLRLLVRLPFLLVAEPQSEMDGAFQHNGFWFCVCVCVCVLTELT